MEAYVNMSSSHSFYLEVITGKFRFCKALGWEKKITSKKPAASLMAAPVQRRCGTDAERCRPWSSCI